MIAEAGETPFWRFSLAVYDRPAVADACLALQDRRGLDVNLLLFCLWAGACGRALSRRDLRRLGEAVAEWQAEAVRPLRAVRRWLKTQGAIPSEAAASLRRGVQEKELQAEQLEQLILHQALPLAAGDPHPPAGAANLLAYVSERVCACDDQDRAHLCVLLRAAFPDVTAPRAAGLLQVQAESGAAERTTGDAPAGREGGPCS